MKQLTNISELKGKTIEKAVSINSWNAQPVIVFTDDTYVVFEVDFGYDQGDGDIEVSTYELDNDDKLEVGFISQEEHDLIQKEETQEYKREQENSERRTYEQLKKKYEGG
jgi:hypothetical protein